MRTRDARKVDAIRETALRMIVEEGFKGMSMQKLAKKAGVSPATIYLYYKDRNDLLHQLYLEVLDRTNEAALVKFRPSMSFAEGLKQLWLNRYRYYTRHPNDFYFVEQFINSPLVRRITDKEDQTYRGLMRQFYQNAIASRQLKKLPFEVYWTLCNSPLYQLIRFHLQDNIHPHPAMKITEKKLLATLELVLKALHP